MKFFLKLNLRWKSLCSKWWTSYFDIHGTLTKASHVLLFDYDHNDSNLRLLIVSPTLQLSAVHLVDAHLCSDPGKYISALMLSLSTMLHLELPHINVLSKIDLIENYGKLGQINFMTSIIHKILPSWTPSLSFYCIMFELTHCLFCSVQPWLLHWCTRFILFTASSRSRSSIC